MDIEIFAQKIKNFYEDYWARRLCSPSNVTAIRFKTILRLLPKSFSKVLDVGCGDGTTLSLIKRHYGNFQDFGFDISERAVKLAKDKGVNAFVQNADDPFPFPDSFFDVIICSEVLEHLVFPGKCVKEIYRVLRSGGVAIFSIPNLGFIKNRIRLLFGISPCDQGRFCRSEHLHYWTCSSFKYFLKIYNFKVLMVKGIKDRSWKNILTYNFPCIFSDYIFFKTCKMTPHARE